MDVITKLIIDVERKMKEKKIKKGDMSVDLKMSNITIANIFNAYKGNVDTLRKIIDYVDNY
ncbi:MAG: hypothetical protein ACRC5T_06295 [Cetobacterium sp.]